MGSFYICVKNVQCLVSKFVNKLQSSEIKEIFHSHDIVIFTENWTNVQSDLVVNGFDHYVLHRVTKKKSSKGDSDGIIAYVANSLKSM